MLSLYIYCVFFFSSRRRHTRCYRDWSSDVCSSDLDEEQSLRVRWLAAAGSGATIAPGEHRRPALTVAATGRRIQAGRGMRPNRTIRCADFPCRDVDRKAYSIPGVAIDASSVSLILISEAAAPNPADNYYARGRPLFQQTTVQAFQDAGADVESIRDILDLGVYLTTPVQGA